jgi:tRNA 2-selenouridine synthase
MFQDITIEELLKVHKQKNAVLIDVRSPSEFEEFTIAGSVNIPFFTDKERSEIGTLYKQVSVQAAKERGLEIVSAKLPAFVKEFAAIPGQKVVYCWRGGMRSKTTATVLSLMGIHTNRLAGGIREYRKWVVDTLNGFEFKPHCIVLNGYTGTGKTHILRTLAEEGYPVLDLEGLAGHRGSIFGQIGLKPRNQKTFEGALLHELLRLNDEPIVFIEAESKRIGRVTLPESVIRAKDSGTQFFLDLPKEERIRNILADYEPHKHAEECIEAFERIRKRIHTPVATDIAHNLQGGDFAAATALLLEFYYDQRYEHAAGQYDEEPIPLHVSTVDEALEALRGHYDRLLDAIASAEAANLR